MVGIENLKWQKKISKKFQKTFSKIISNELCHSFNGSIIVHKSNTGNTGVLLSGKGFKLKLSLFYRVTTKLMLPVL